MKLLKLIAKDLRILIRSRSASSIIILGPLIIMLIAGLAFDNTSPFDLTVGVTTVQETQNSVLFTEALRNEYTVVEYSDEALCQNGVTSGQLHACIVYPANFVIAENKENVISLYVDSSKANIAELIRRSLLGIIGDQRNLISSVLTTDLVGAIDSSASDLALYRRTHLSTLKQEADDLQVSFHDIGERVSNLSFNHTDPRLTLEGFDTTALSIESQSSQMENEARRALSNLKGFAQDIEDLNISPTLNDWANESLERVNEISLSMFEISEGINAKTTGLLSSIRIADGALTDLKSQLTLAEQQQIALGTDISTQTENLGIARNRLETLDKAIVSTSQTLTGLENTDVDSIVTPVTVDSKTVVANTSKLNFLLPHLMLMVVMFVAVLLSSMLVIMEKNSPARFRIFTTPTHQLNYIMSVFITVSIILFIQIIAIIAVAHAFFEVDLLSNVINIIVLLLFATFTFIGIGMSIGYLFNSQQTGLLAAISVGSFFLLISDLILPLESMPAFMQQIMAYSPFIIASQALRSAIIFGSTIQSQWTLVGMLIAYAVLFLSIIYILQELSRKIFIVKQNRQN